MTTSNHKTYRVRRYFSLNIRGDPSGGFLEAVLRLWKASWRLLKGLLEASGGLLEASGLEALGVNLGASWALCCPRSSQDVPKKVPRHPQNSPKRPQEASKGP